MYQVYLSKTVITVYSICILFLLVACSGNGLTWESTLSKQAKAPSSIQKIDSSVLQFMYKYHIPGMSIALFKNDQILYAKGYGFADKAKKLEVTTASLFRVGDISCTITSMAIMQLIKAGKLSMTAKVFGDSGILKNEYGTPPYSKHITDITVYDLLQHVEGGWADNDDPIFLPVLRSASVDKARLMGITLDHVPLKAAPGSQFAFSRFGYFVLGMIIEKVSGQLYADFVTKQVLNPAGISDMCITADTEADKKKQEVICYKEEIKMPFVSEELDDDFFQGRSAACAGWLATSRDLVTLINAHILDSTTNKLMFTPSTINPHYACGWWLSDDKKNWYCISQVFGSTSEFVRAENGFSWALLINTNRPVAKDYISDMDVLGWKLLTNGGFLRQ